MITALLVPTNRLSPLDKRVTLLLTLETCDVLAGGKVILRNEEHWRF